MAWSSSSRRLLISARHSRIADPEGGCRRSLWRRLRIRPATGNVNLHIAVPDLRPLTAPNLGDVEEATHD
jgi:hypothetical protein